MKTHARLVVCSMVVLIGGCATVPTGPSVLALPGTGKTLNEFRSSDIQCYQYAAQSIGSGPASDPGVRNAVVGTAVGAAAGAAIGGQQGAGLGAGAGLVVGSVSGAQSSRIYGYEAQRLYDNAYIQCMYASGHKVPVSASMAKSLTQIPVIPASAANIPPPPTNQTPPSSPPPDYLPAPASR